MTSQFIINLSYKLADVSMAKDQQLMNNVYQTIGLNIVSHKTMEMNQNQRMDYLLCSCQGVDEIDIIQKMQIDQHTVQISLQTESSPSLMIDLEKKLNQQLDIANCKQRFLTKITNEHSNFFFNKVVQQTFNFTDFKYVDYQQSMFQQLKVYDTQQFGRVLLIDNMVQFTRDLEDNYTKDLSRLVVQKDKEYEKILIIGAGDMIIPSYLLRRFKIKKLVQCEIDKGVTDIVRSHFSIAENIQNNIDNGRFELIFDDGSKYIKEMAAKGELYDGIIIDNSDVDYINSPASVLFTVEFFTDIKKCLKPGASFSQQTSHAEVNAVWNQRVKEAGFENIGVLWSETPEYSIHLPLGQATN